MPNRPAATVRIPAALHDEVTEVAERRGISPAWVVASAIRHALEDPAWIYADARPDGGGDGGER
jgi:predicted transcriptional regulator